MNQEVIKNITPALDKIIALEQPKSYQVSIPGHHLNDEYFDVKKSERQYEFSSSSSIIKGVQTHKELEFNSNDELSLINSSNGVIYVKGKEVLLSSISYDYDDDRKVFTGQITGFSTTSDIANFNEKFHRMIIPVSSDNALKYNDFERRPYRYKNSKTFRSYLGIDVASEEYHLYSLKYAGRGFILLDSMQKSNFVVFQKKCFNILLAFASVKGDLIHDECFVISYNEVELDVIENVYYNSMRTSILTNQPTFTANPFSVYHGTDKIKISDGGKIDEKVRAEIYEGMIDFPSKSLSLLATLCYQEEKIQRALLLFIQGHVASLETKLPNYYVALEAVTSVIASKKGVKKDLNPIKNRKLAQEVSEHIIYYINSVKTEKNLSDDDFALDILVKNVNKLNAPPNADKLAEAFGLMHYTLSAEEKKVLKERNTILHGSFLKIEGDDKEFREALHLSLRLRFMISVLVLKMSEFEGKIINYAALWSNITEKNISEDRLIKI